MVQRRSDSPGDPVLDTPERERSVKAVEHAAEILVILGSQQVGVGVTSLAKQLDLNVSSVHHILRTLQSYQLVEQSPNSKLYRLGVRSLRLGQAYLAGLDLYSIATPLLKRVALECGETVSLVAVEGLRLTQLATIPSSHTVRSIDSPTSRHNSHASALGKVLLSAMSASDLREHIAQVGLARFTSHTITSFRQLEDELRQVRERGYGLDLEELEAGLCCVATGVRNHADELIAALVMSVPSSRFDDDQSRFLIRLATRAAGEISGRLGYQSTEPQSHPEEVVSPTANGPSTSDLVSSDSKISEPSVQVSSSSSPSATWSPASP
jgi:IclR family transcriptional regulator, KDG regulon repressor